MSFVILAETLSTGEQNFLLLFPMPVQPLAQSQKHSRCLSKRPWRGRGGKRGGGHQLRSAIVCLRKRRRGSPPLPGPLPALTSSLLLVHKPHNGATSKISPAGLSQAGRPPPQMSSILIQGVEGQPRGGRDTSLSRFVLSQQLLLIFCRHCSPLINSCTKGSPHLRLVKCHGMEGWARSS